MEKDRFSQKEIPIEIVNSEAKKIKGLELPLRNWSAALLLLLLMTICSLTATAQNQMHVSVTVTDATCFNNGLVRFNVTDAQGHPLSENANYKLYRNYYKLFEGDSAHYSNYGVDTLLRAPGTLTVGYEAAYWNGTDWELQNFDTLVTIGTSYHIPQASAIYTTSTTLDGFGRRPTLDCMNSGRIQLKIEYGRFPYTVVVCPHGTNDTLRTVTFDTYQNIDGSGNLLNTTNTSKYDYKDYYTFDSLATGDWDFYVTDGCGYGLPRTGQRVEVINFPKLDHINVYSSSGNLADSNVVKISAVLDREYHYYNFQLPEWVQYRFTYDGLDTSEWKSFPYASSNSIILYDTVYSAHSYCDLYERNITFEYEQTACNPKDLKKSFKIYPPAETYFLQDYSDTTEAAENEVDPCTDNRHFHTKFYSINYSATYNINSSAEGHDPDRLRFHYTHPLTWIYTDTDSNVVIKREEVSDITTASYLTAGDVTAKYGSFKDRDLNLNIERKLVDGKGCVLYTTNDVLMFVDTIGPQLVDWLLGKKDGDHCCTTKGVVSVGEHHRSWASPDGTIIRLTQSPYNNKYNFEAVYDENSRSWTVSKANLENMATIEGAANGRSLNLSDYCLPSGPYKFDIITVCDTITIAQKLEFPDRYSVEVTEPFSFSQEQHCTDNYLTYETGKISLVKRNTDINTGLEKVPEVTPLTCQFGVVSGPTGGYDSKYVNLGGQVRISMPGTFILKYGPTSTSGYCGEVVFYDTLKYEGASVDFVYAYAMLCDTSSHSGTVYVKGKSGTLPYTYKLYSGPNMTGTLMSSNSTGVFPNMNFSAGDVLSCQITDDCLANFYVNITPSTWEKTQLLWFEGELTEDTRCEGSEVTLHALTVDDVLGYHWTGPNGFISDSPDNTIQLQRGAESGWYKAQLLNTGCSSDIMDSIYLEVIPAPSVSLSMDHSDTICPATPVEVHFTPNSTANPTALVKYTVAEKTSEGIRYEEMEGVSGTTQTLTLNPMRTTELFVTSISDGGCDYKIPEDTLLITVRTDVVNSCSILTSDTLVCSGSDAQLHAKSTLEVPYTMNWYADYEQTIKLKSEEITSADQWSYYDTADIRKRTELYVSVEKDGACPAINGLPTNTMNIETGSSVIHCGETYRLYDSGGSDGNYGTNESFKQVLSSDNGDHLQLRFDYIELNQGAKLYLFKGDQPVMDSLLCIFEKDSMVPEFINIPSDKATFWFISSLQTTDRGWSANISHAPKVAVADCKLPMLEPTLVTTDDAVCYGNTAHLTASSDIAYPQYYTWWDKDMTTLLYSDTVTSGVSHFNPEHQISDTLYYVHVYNDANCPYIPAVHHHTMELRPDFLFNTTSVDTIFVACSDSIPFFDQGGKYSNISSSTFYYQVLKAEPGSQIVLHIDTLKLNGSTYSLQIYDGKARTGTPIKLYDAHNITITSTTGYLYLYQRSFYSASDIGWIGYITTTCKNSDLKLAESHVAIKAPLGHEALTTTNDTVCYDNTAALTASSEVSYPQYFTWWDKDMTTLLHSDTVSSGASHFNPEHQVSDTLYYVHIYNDNSCPYIPEAYKHNRELRPALLMNKTENSPVDILFLACNDSVPFFDDGGEYGNVSPGGHKDYYQIIEAEPGSQVVLHIDTLNLSTGSYSLQIYDGKAQSGKATMLGGAQGDTTITSTTGSLFLHHRTIQGYMGWKGSITTTCEKADLAESHVSIKAPLGKESITATDDAVCYGNTAHLTASSDIAYPQYYTWWDKDMTTLLYSDTVTSGVSHFNPDHQISDTLYYVQVYDSLSCPYNPTAYAHNLLPAYNLNSITIEITSLFCRDSIPFYDAGGKNGNVPTSKTYQHLFKAEPGKQVTIHIDTLELPGYSSCALKIYDGESSYGTLLAELDGRKSNVTYTSTTGSLFVSHYTGSYSNYMGWEGSVVAEGCEEVDLAEAYVSIKKPLDKGAITTTDDAVCYDNTAHLTASSDVAYPQYYSWWASDRTTLLHQDTLWSAGEKSHFNPEHQISDSLYYVRISNDTSCPYIPSVYAYNLRSDYNMMNGETIFLACGDSIPFYDGAGKNGANMVSNTTACVFKAEPGKQLTIHIDTLNIGSSSWLSIYDGVSTSGTLLAAFSGKHSKFTCTSNSGTLYVYSYLQYAGNMGWEGSVVAECNPYYAESHVTIKTPLGSEAISTTDDLVCYDNTAHLTASSDIAYPQYFSWMASDGITVLAQDTIWSAGEKSHFNPEHQISDSLYYVCVENDVSCPYIPSVHIRNLQPDFLMQDYRNISLACGDSIPFYDEGGKSGNTSFTSGTYDDAVFKAEPGNQVTIHIDTLSLYNNSSYYLKIYDGESSSGTLLATFYGNSSNQTVTSTTGALFVYVRNYPGYMGWEGSIVSECNPYAAKSHVTIKAPTGSDAISATDDAVCYDNTAHLTASSELAYPQYYSWWATDKTTCLGRDTVYSAGEAAHFNPEHQISDTLYYVSVSDSLSCPYRPELASLFEKKRMGVFQLSPNKSNQTTILACGDTLNFYDDGGISGNYSDGKNICHTFKAAPGHQVVLTFSDFSTQMRGDTMFIYDGETTSSPCITILKGNVVMPLVRTSTNGSLTVKWVADKYTNSPGWEGTITTDCSYLAEYLAESHVTIKKPFALEPVITTDDEVCYDNTAHLTASSELAYPQYYSWWADDKTTWLGSDTVYSAEEVAHFNPEHQVSDNVYYVNAYDSLNCPYRPEFVSLFEMMNWKGDFLLNADVDEMTTELFCGDSLNFYDEGGALGRYSMNKRYYHTFKAEDGEQVVLTINTFKIAYGAQMRIYDGDILLASLTSSNNSSYRPKVYTSTNSVLSVSWYGGNDSQGDGWEGTITTVCKRPYLAESNVIVKFPLGADAISATNDIVCYDGTAALTASSDIDFPQYYTWWDNTHTILLYSDTVTSGVSHFNPEHQIQDSTYYVNVYSSTQCPYVPEVYQNLKVYQKPTVARWEGDFLMSTDIAQNTTILSCGDSLNFYDDGGRMGDYSYCDDEDDEYCSLDYYHTFKAEDGAQIILQLTSFNSEGDGYDYMCIYDGPVPSADHLLDSLGGYYDAINNIYTSTSGSLTVRWVSDYSYTYSGWEGAISTICEMSYWKESRVSVLPYIAPTDLTTETCQSSDPYTYLGFKDIDVSTTGVYTIDSVFKSAATGCDSIVTLHLTVNPSYNQEENVTICQSELPYTWRDTTFKAETVTGDYVFNRQTALGCDSIVTLHLTVNPSYNQEENVTICQSELPYTWRDTTFNAETVTDDYIFNRHTVNGCDSIVTLHLTVNPAALDMDNLTDYIRCNGNAFSVTPTGNIPEGTLYTWTVADNANVTGQSAQTTPVAAPISQTLTNNSDSKQTVVYTVTPITGECVGEEFTITVTVFPKPGPSLVCPPDINRTLEFGSCALLLNPNDLGTPTWASELGLVLVDTTNNAPADNIYFEGDNIVRWIGTDECGNADTCEQHVIVIFPQCPDAVDYEGNVYHGVRIDCDCWTQRNLESHQYSDGTDIPGIYSYISDMYPDSAANAGTFGLLYDWESAIRDGQDNGHGHVQGICPEGWYLPTAEKYDALNAHGATALKSPNYWIDGGGDNSTGFTSLPAGYYDGSISRYINLMGEAYYWSTTKVDGNWGSSASVIQYQCGEISDSYVRSGLGYSVRCVKEKE